MVVSIPTHKMNLVLLCVAAFCCLMSTAAGDDSKQVIETFHVQTDIRYRFATTRMVSVLRNTAGTDREMMFGVTLPKKAFIVSFAMTIDGKVYDGEVKEKSKAKEQYNRAVQRGQSAGHIRQTPRHSNRFDVSVNVANGTAVNFALTYQELLTRRLGIYEYEMHVKPGQAVKDFNVEVFIQENRPLQFVKTPKLRKGSVISNEVEASSDLTVVDRPSPTTAHIRYQPTVDQQGPNGLAARFVVQYDVKHSAKGDVLVADGYFLHLFAPNPTSVLLKDIIFVLDVSGSMSGTKIRQLKQAMKTILGDLNEEDRFNVLTFSYNVSRWKPSLTMATPEVISEALKFVDTMYANGGTNINQGLMIALDDLQKREIQSRVGMVFFLTDGQATAGETNNNKIAENILETNDDKALFSLGFGEGANFEFLKTISTQNFGFARKIYEASDAALQVESLYKEISLVSLKNVSIEYLPSIKKTTETAFPVVFRKSEIAVCGFLDSNDYSYLENEPVFKARINGLEEEGEIDLVLEIDDIADVTINGDDSLNPFFTLPVDYAGIIEKMWAFMTIRQMLKEKQKVIEDKEKVEAMDKKILKMSLKYKFVTPLTSMVVTKPNMQGEDDNDKKSQIEAGLDDVDAMTHRPYSPHMLQSRTGYGGAPGRSHIQSSFAMGSFSGGVYSSPGLKRGNKNSQHYHSPVFNTYRASTSNKASSSTTPDLGTTTGKKNKSRGKKIKSRGSRKIIKKNRKGKAAKWGILRSVVFNNNQTSMCLAPKRLESGKYVLVKADNDFRIELSTGCLRKCRFVVPEQLSLTSNGKTLTVNLTSLSSWEYNQHSEFDITFFGLNKMVMEHQDALVSIKRTQVRKKMFYSLELVLSPKKKLSGMIDYILRSKPSKKRKQRKMPKGCTNTNVNRSLVLTKRKARRYKV